MATLELKRTFVNLMTTGEAVSGNSARGRAEDYETATEVRTFAGGRRRAITSAGEVGTYACTLLLLPRASVETLRTWQGQLVQVRDNKGRRFVGVYKAVSVTEIVSRTTWHVHLELTVVTVAEGV